MTDITAFLDRLPPRPTPADMARVAVSVLPTLAQVLTPTFSGRKAVLFREDNDSCIITRTFGFWSCEVNGYSPAGPYQNRWVSASPDPGEVAAFLIVWSRGHLAPPPPSRGGWPGDGIESPFPPRGRPAGTWCPGRPHLRHSQGELTCSSH